MSYDLLGIPAYYCLAAALGAFGQVIRGALGLIKAYRATRTIEFDPYLYAATLVLGAVSGLLGALVYDLPGIEPGDLSFRDLQNDRNYLLMAVAAGYFGADVIEGVLGRYAPPRSPHK